MVGGYSVHGAAVDLPPDDYTYSDTGMFLDPATGMAFSRSGIQYSERSSNYL